MLTIEATATLTPDGQLTIAVPPEALPLDLPVGTYHILVVLEEPLAAAEDDDLDDFPVVDLGPWPEDLSLRREDMYDDWGR